MRYSSTYILQPDKKQLHCHEYVFVDKKADMCDPHVGALLQDRRLESKTIFQALRKVIPELQRHIKIKIIVEGKHDSKNSE